MKFILEKKQTFGGIPYAALDLKDVHCLVSKFSQEVLVIISKQTVDFLAEESRTVGLVVYPDPPEVSSLYQFRLRRSQSFQGIDLREILKDFSIRDGGGHPGAVGFRVPRSEIPDLKTYIETILGGIRDLIQKDQAP